MKKVLFVILFSGCAAPSFKAADCDRFRYASWNILACNDDSVNLHCRKWINKLNGTLDNGQPLGDKRLAGCYRPAFWCRKGNIIISKDWLTCLPHETCHADGISAEICDKKYPCINK